MNKFNLKNFIIVIPINMKLKQLIDSNESLVYLSSQKLTATISYKVAMVIKNTKPSLEEFFKVRDEKVKEYGEEIIEKEKPTGRYNIKEENKEKFQKEIEELLEQEVNLTIPELKIKDFDGLSLEPRYLVQLDWLIKE
jgi:uncharacterized protein (DUF2344 family)